RPENDRDAIRCAEFHPRNGVYRGDGGCEEVLHVHRNDRGVVIVPLAGLASRVADELARRGGVDLVADLPVQSFTGLECGNLSRDARAKVGAEPSTVIRIELLHMRREAIMTR